MIKNFYISSIIIFFYQVFTIHLLIGHIQYITSIFFGYLLWNIGILIYWYFDSWTWNDGLRMKNYENQEVTVYSYQFNPLFGTISAWLNKDNKWIITDGKTFEYLLAMHMEVPLFVLIGFNVGYGVLYTVMLLLLY